MHVIVELTQDVQQCQQLLKSVMFTQSSSGFRTKQLFWSSASILLVNNRSRVYFIDKKSQN